MENNAKPRGFHVLNHVDERRSILVQRHERQLQLQRHGLRQQSARAGENFQLVALSIDLDHESPVRAQQFRPQARPISPP